MHTSYNGVMEPNISRGNEMPHRTSLIVDLEKWLAFEAIAKRQKKDRATLIREFIDQQIAKAAA